MLKGELNQKIDLAKQLERNLNQKAQEVIDHQETL